MADEPCKEKEYTFVQETIRPQKKNRVKKAASIAASAAAFGVVSSIVFCACLPLFSEYFKVNNKQIIIGKREEFDEVSGAATAMAQNTPTNTPTDPPTEEPKKTKEPEDDGNQSAVVGSDEKVQKICQKVNRSIVKVNSMKSSYDIFSGGNTDTGATSGIVIGKSEKQLFIYVNANRIDEKDSVLVTFSNNAIVSASVYGKQEELGIMILSIELSKIPTEALATVELAEFSNTDELSIGESVLALGNPNGHLYSLACGVVSNAPYNAYMVDNSITLFNTTINCNGRGDGVLVNMSGEIIGFTTHVPGFAGNLNYDVNTCYSSDTLKPIITKIVNGSAQIYFGIKACDITSEITYQTGIEAGIYITGVQNNSPAFYADLKKGDVITAVDDKNVMNSAQFNSIINKYNEKDKVVVTFYRNVEGKQVKKKLEVSLSVIK